MNIETELQKVTKVKPKADEPRQEYLVRMVKALPINETWDDLPLEVQTWANKMIAADNADKDIPDFPEDESASSNSKDTSMETTTGSNGAAPRKKKAAAKADAAPKKKAAAGKAPAKAAPPKKVAAKKEPKERAARSPREDGVKYRIKKMLVKKPDMSAEDIITQLKKDGDKPSKFTVGAIRSEFRHTLQVLRDLNWPKVDI